MESLHFGETHSVRQWRRPNLSLADSRNATYDTSSLFTKETLVYLYSTTKVQKTLGKTERPKVAIKNRTFVEGLIDVLLPKRTFFHLMKVFLHFLFSEAGRYANGNSDN